ncbi:MAG TPA: MMPL family transporter [Kofleriaceae bacterium]|nr:MMPL family transporter [Kofleriaceae bacterium]
MARQRVEWFAAWIDRSRIGVLVLSVLLAALGGYLASRMSIRSDLTSLLPPSQPSVHDLTQIQARARPFGTVQIAIEAADPAARARTAAALTERLANLPADLVAQFSADDRAIHRYVWDHRFLFADLTDLIAARDALAERLRRGTLAANPLFIPLDDDDDRPPANDRWAELERKLAEAEARATRPPPRVSKDGRIELLVVQTVFPASDAARAGRLLGAIEAAIAEVRPGPGVAVNLTGNITTAMHEHDSVLEGMLLSVAITVLLVGIALVLYYRSGALVLAMLWALGVGVATTFAAAWAAVGHLNVMTAFLFAIVVGNGINPGLIVSARYVEELRAGAAPERALPRAISGALRGTLAAMATAAVAYTSLLVTDFRGFRQFGAIAGLGMVLTWATTFTVLPAALAVLGRWRPPRVGAPRAIGRALVRLIPERGYGVVLAFGGVLTAAALAVTADYIARDPFTRDWRDLQSSTPAIRKAGALDARLRAGFDTRALLSGQAYQLAIAVEDRAQVAPLVAALRRADAARPEADRWIHDVRSLDDLLPADQPRKLEVLAEIRALIDDPKLQASLEDEGRATLAKLRPPEHLRPLGDTDAPRELAWPFIERDGSIGRLIVVRGARRFDSFNVDHRLAFAAEARRLELPAGALVAGEALVVADIIESMERDAPRMIGFALLGSILAVILVVGLRRHGLVTIACGLAGVVVMIAACALAGLTVHFLDLIALPITIGIGVDYAVNLAVRDRQEGDRGPRHLLATTGGAVLLCSYTTTVGYGTLMLSANGGIRAFGLAALLGEVACVLMALVIAPAWLALLRARDGRGATPP